MTKTDNSVSSSVGEKLKEGRPNLEEAKAGNPMRAVLTLVGFFSFRAGKMLAKGKRSSGC